MAYGDKILLGILIGTVILALCCFIIPKIHSYRVNKYNNEVKNKLKNAVKYLFGEAYNEYFEYGHTYFLYKDNYKAFAKTIFVDKKNIGNMVSFAKHVFEKYHCEYTSHIFLLIHDIQDFACKYKSLDDYLYRCGLKNKSTLNTIINKHKDEIIEIEKKRFFNV